MLIAGSITGFGQPLLDIIQEVIIKKSLAASVSETEVEFASLEDQIVYLGTAALVLSNELGVCVAMKLADFRPEPSLVTKLPTFSSLASVLLMPIIIRVMILAGAGTNALLLNL
ncbi:MAG: hypothetical protein M5U34_01500 [Chloroflexi bacterium]|nr:hypothetical protein [Chloroflexota bacterium]